MENINAVETINKLALYISMETARQKIEGDKWAKILSEPNKYSMVEVAHANHEMDMVTTKLDMLLTILKLLNP